MLLLLLCLKIVQVSTKNIVEFKDVPYSWCDEDYPITDLIDTSNADDTVAAIDDDDIAFEEISY